MSDMTDADFVKELARRLNTFLEQAPERANAVLATPIPHAGYAGVAHFLGELAMPSGITDKVKMGDLQEALFLYPTIDDSHRIVKFEVMLGSDLAKRAEEDQKPPVH